MDTPVPPHRPRWRTLILLALLLAPMLWPLKQLSESYYNRELLEQNSQTLDLYVANLLGILRRFEVLPPILGQLPDVRDALEHPEEPQHLTRANVLLDSIRQQTGADVIYLLDQSGKTLASSNWSQPDSFIGGNFSFRPYFHEALKGITGQFFGLGTTSGKRGYYFGAPIMADQQLIGVLVVKVDLDHTETLWGNTPEHFMVTDANDVVILTSQPSWRFRARRALSEDERHWIDTNIPYPTRSPQPLQLDQDKWITQSRILREPAWTVSILAPRALVDRQVQTTLAIGTATLLTILLVIGLLMQRRRHYLERIELNSRARRQLEQRVQERTRDLQTLNERLKQEVLEREQAQQELVMAQDDLVQAGKLSALGTMSASISHELNQPLAAIRSYADNAIVLIDHQRTEDARSNLNLISELTTRMASIIAHLKAFARRDRKAPESVALQPALEDALALLSKQRRALEVELVKDLPDAPLWVQAGETRLRQILGNLLANALDALSETPSPRRIWISASPGQDHVTLSMRDNGPGFSEQALQHAREPFFSTKATAKGLGLGLSICDTLISALGGELRLANHPDGGAHITLLLQPGVPGVTPQPLEDHTP